MINTRRQNVMARNFEAALVKAARSNFSMKSIRPTAKAAAVSAEEIKDWHAKHDVQRYRDEIDQ